MNLVMSQDMDVLVANAVTGADTTQFGALKNARVSLVNADIALSPTTSWGDVSASIGGYQGYSDGTITFNSPSVSGEGQVESLGSVPLFRPTGSDSPQNMYGLVVTRSASRDILMVGMFDNAPLPMGNSLNVIDIVVRWRSGTGGSCEVLT